MVTAAGVGTGGTRRGGEGRVLVGGEGGVLGLLCEAAPSQFCSHVNVRAVEVNNDHTEVGVPSHLLDLGREESSTRDPHG